MRRSTGRHLRVLAFAPALSLTPLAGAGDRAAAAQSSGVPHAGLAPGEHPAGLTHVADNEVDSEHIFGFTLGTDIGKKGEFEPEIQPVAAFGKQFGAYFATASVAQIKYTATDSFRVAPGILITSHNIGGSPGLPDRSQIAAAGASLEMSYRLMDRQLAPFGLTLKMEPGWNPIEEASGARVEHYGADFGVLIDKELVAARLYGAVNVNYGFAGTRLGGGAAWLPSSALSVSAALTNQVLPGVFVGAEARYLQQYEGSALRGEALYAGPTFCVKFGAHTAVSGSWTIQAAGRAADGGGPLDLANFERHQVLLRLNTILNPD